MLSMKGERDQIGSYTYFFYIVNYVRLSFLRNNAGCGWKACLACHNCPFVIEREREGETIIVIILKLNNKCNMLGNIPFSACHFI